MKKALWILSLLICGALVFCLFEIRSLHDEIHSLRNDLNRVSRNAEDDINLIYNNVNRMLEEQNNQLTSGDWEYVSVDLSKKTATVFVSFISKEHKENATKAILQWENGEQVLEFFNGQYAGEIELPLFETTSFTQLVLKELDTVRTQKIDWSINPRYEFLLMPYAYFNGNGRGIVKNTEFIWQPDGSIHINAEKKGNHKIKKIDLVEMLDGKEIHRESIGLSKKEQRNYADELSKNGETVPEHIYSETEEEYSGNVSFLYPFKKEIHIPNGSEYLLFVDVVDETDLIYRCFIEGYPILKDGDIDDMRMDELRMYSFAEPMLILDSKGEVLFEVEPGLFQ